MLVVGNVVFSGVAFGERGRQRRRVADAVRERVVRGLHQRYAAFGGQQTVDSAESRLRCRGAVESRQLQRLPRGQRDRLRLTPVPSSVLPATEKNAGKLGRVDILRRDIIRRAAGPSGGAVALRDRSLPRELLIGMRKQIQRNWRPAALILRPRQRLHQRADIRHHRQFLARKQAGDFGQLGVKRVRRAGDAGDVGVRFAAGQREASANRRDTLCNSRRPSG